MPTAPAAATAKLPASSLVASAVGSSWAHVETELDHFCRRPEQAESHDLRVGIRRFFAALDLARALDDEPIPPKLAQRVKRLLAALSPLRDIEIQREALDKHELDAESRQALARLLERDERALRRRLAQRLADFPRKRAGLAVARACAALRDTEGDRSPAGKLAVLGAVAQRYFAFERRRRASDAGDLDTLHAARVAFKKYRYAVELGAPLLRPVSAQGRDAMKHFQDQLGALQDSVVVIELFERVRSTRPLARSLETEQRALAGRLQELLHAQSSARIPEFSQPLR